MLISSLALSPGSQERGGERESPINFDSLGTRLTSSPANLIGLFTLLAELEVSNNLQFSVDIILYTILEITCN